MSLLAAILILLAVDALAVAGVLVVRRLAPPGGFFGNVQWAGGVLGVVGTAFAVLLAFTFLVAFQSYETAREDAEIEANAVVELFRTAELFDERVQERLQADLRCYAEEVVDHEWAAMRDERSDDHVEDAIERLHGTIKTISPAGGGQAVALDAWFNEVDRRQEGRRGRLLEASTLVPTFVWVMLIIGGAIVIAFVSMFADPRGRLLAQGFAAVSVATLVASGLLMVHFFDHPYEGHAGGIEPSSMRAAIEIMDRAGEPSCVARPS